MRVALDTNILVSAVATRGICADLVALVLREHVMVVGETVLAELARVLAEKLLVPADAVADVVGLLRREASIAAERAPIDLELTDQADLHVVAEAVAGGADVLVTGDRELLGAADRAPIAIVTPRGFWESLRGDARVRRGRRRGGGARRPRHPSRSA